MKRLSSRPGFSLAELLVVVAIIGLVVSIALPNFATMRKRAALRAAAREIASVLRHTRSTAIARGHHVGVKFKRTDGGEWRYSIYADGDFDGIRSDDIRAGRDVLIGPSRPVLLAAGGATIGLPPTAVADPDDGSFLDDDASPVKFGKPALCSFSPLGGGTAGSIYVTDRFENVAIIRVVGATGRVRILIYDAGAKVWR